MQDIVTTLAHKEQPLVWAVRRVGIAAPGTGLATVVGIHFDGHTCGKGRFVGNVAVQFSKRPPGGVTICPSLLLARGSALLAFGAFADMGQVLQTNDAVWVLGHDALTDLVVSILFQPSLSPANRNQATGSRTSAFLLQPLSQSRIVIGFGANGLAGIKGRLVGRGGCHRQIALPYINPYHVLVTLRSGVCHHSLKGHQQVELLARLVVPQLCRSDGYALLDESQRACHNPCREQ